MYGYHIIPFKILHFSRVEYFLYENQSFFKYFFKFYISKIKFLHMSFYNDKDYIPKQAKFDMVFNYLIKNIY